MIDLVADFQKVRSGAAALGWTTVVADCDRVLAYLAPPPVVPVFHTQVIDWDSNPKLADGVTDNPNYKAIRNHTCLDVQWPRGGYVRTGDSSSYPASIFTSAPFSLAFGTTAAKLDYPKYGLLRDGVEVAAATVTAGSKTGRFVGNWPPTADGPAQLDIVAYDAAGARVASPIGTLGSFRVWFDMGGTAKNHPDVFAQTNSFVWMHPGTASYNSARWVPPTYAWVQYPKASLKDNPRPLVPRASVPAFNTVVPVSGLQAIEVLPGNSDNDYLEVYRPVVTDSGITLTENKQPYFTDGFMKEQPQHPIIPGPCGVARATHFTFLKFTERPAPSTKLLWGNNYAVGDFDVDGQMNVWFGFYNTYAPYWADVNKAIAAGVLHKSIAIRGKWQASIPPIERRARRPWGLEWDRTTLGLSPVDPPINGEPPHGKPDGTPLNPTCFVGDDHGFVLRGVFDGHDRSVEPTMDRFIPERPWGLTQFNGQLITSSRYTHRLAIWNMQTGDHVNDILSVPQAANIGSINPGEDNFVFATGKTVADARALPMCFTEAIAIMDGWLYYFSSAQQQVRRLDMATGAIQVCCDVPWSTVQSRLAQMVVSDGSFYPRHTIATCAFDNQYYGRPRLWIPNPGDGSAAAWTGATQSAARTHSATPWFNQYSDDLTVASPSQGGIYPMSMAFGTNGLGAFACAGSEERVAIYVKRQAGDPVNNDATANAGHRDFRSRMFQLYWNTLANSNVATPLPRGTTASMDAWFNMLGRP